MSLGTQGNSEELEKMTPEKGNVIEAPEDEDPKKIMESIARVAFKSKKNLFQRRYLLEVCIYIYIYSHLKSA